MLIHAQSHTLDLLGGPHAPACENRALRFSRYTDPSLKEESRRAFLDVAIKQRLPESVCQSRLDNYDSFLDAVPGVVRIYAENKARLLLNMSGSAMENAGCSLDRLTGLPYIPGSAIKGIARHAALERLKSDITDNRPDYLANLAFVFGWVSDDWSAKSDLAWAAADAIPEAKKCIERALGLFPKEFAGAITFFGAMQKTFSRHDLELDIVTSHHKDYYAEKIPVALDNELPNPVVFPAIAAGQLFGFALAPAARTQLNAAHVSSLLTSSKQWLIDGIENFGLGAKTAAGYGWFDSRIDAATQQTKKQRQKQEQFEAWRKGLNLDEVPPESVAEAIKEIEVKLESFAPLTDQRIIDAINRNRGRIPQRSEVERMRDAWSAAPNLKGPINGFVKGFGRASDERKTAIVTLLREPEGRGAEVWAQIKTGQKGDIAKAVEAIRIYCRDKLQLGKMP